MGTCSPRRHRLLRRRRRLRQPEPGRFLRLAGSRSHGLRPPRNHLKIRRRLRTDSKRPRRLRPLRPNGYLVPNDHPPQTPSRLNPPRPNRRLRLRHRPTSHLGPNRLPNLAMVPIRKTCSLVICGSRLQPRHFTLQGRASAPEESSFPTSRHLGAASFDV